MDDDFTVAMESKDEMLVVLQYRGEGYVTIDYKRRSWQLGWASSGPTMRNKYPGRGWGKRLEADARAALKEIYKDKE